jgi:hypothetical protein
MTANPTIIASGKSQNTQAIMPSLQAKKAPAKALGNFRSQINYKMGGFKTVTFGRILYG